MRLAWFKVRAELSQLVHIHRKPFSENNIFGQYALDQESEYEKGRKGGSDEGRNEKERERERERERENAINE